MQRILFLVCFLVYSCSGVGVIEKTPSNLYRPEFLAAIKKIKQTYRTGNQKEAIARLSQMDTNKLTSPEQALKTNLVGVIFFSGGQYKAAYQNFLAASKNSEQDPVLKQQIFLNLASCSFKLGEYSESLNSFNKIQVKQLNQIEQRKYYQLQYYLSQRAGNSKDTFESLLNYLSFAKTIGEVRVNPLASKLREIYFQSNFRDRMNILNDYEDEGLISLAYLALEEVDQLQSEGKKDQILDILDWMNGNLASLGDVKDSISEIEIRLESMSKITVSSIGVVLPLSGSKSNFANRVLEGIDFAIQRKFKNAKVKPVLFIEDSKGSGVIGAKGVQKLVRQDQVGIVIGGLFPSEAKAQYLEAKKNGVFFVSLSPIYLDKEKKNHLLVEIPGSVESQVNTLMSDRMIAKFGKKGAILFPNTPRGKAFVNEFWRVAEERKVDITGVQKYSKKATDYRDLAKNVLGLAYKRERLEEFDIYEKIHKLEGRKAIRRIQTLPPVVDFDWIFLPAHPRNALQIIPSFAYYDAFNIPFLGVPSWRNRVLVQNSQSMKNLFFIGDELNPDKKTLKEFYEMYNRVPKIIELMANDAVSIYGGLSKSFNGKSRTEFEKLILERQMIRTSSGLWNLKDGVWIKRMLPHQIRRGQISPIGLSL